MKTKFYWLALLASAAMIAQASAGGHNGGGGGGGGGHFASGPSRGGYGSSFRSAPARSFSGGRMIYSGQRFAPNAWRSSSPAIIQQRSISSNGSSSLNTRALISSNSSRTDRSDRFVNRGNQTRLNQPRQANSGQIRHGNSLPPNWHNHVAAQRSANWHRDWDRSRDHWWNGHHCRFINGSWVIFDFGFYPWWTDGYPYDYYGYAAGYYDSGAYYGDEEEYYPNDQGSADQNVDSAVAAAQEQLARQGYYRGQIDGFMGPATRQAIERYQSNNRLRATGYLTNDTLHALGLEELAHN